MKTTNQKLILILLIAMLSIIFLVACGNDEQINDNVEPIIENLVEEEISEPIPEIVEPTPEPEIEPEIEVEDNEFAEQIEEMKTLWNDFLDGVEETYQMGASEDLTGALWRKHTLDESDARWEDLQTREHEEVEARILELLEPMEKLEELWNELVQAEQNGDLERTERLEVRKEMEEARDNVRYDIGPVNIWRKIFN